MFLPGKTQIRQRHTAIHIFICGYHLALFLYVVTVCHCCHVLQPGKSFYHRIRPEGVRGSLHSAAAAGNVADIQRLIAGGASVNRSTLGGVAPLHMAAHNGHAEAIARLLSARAEVNQLAPGGTTALHLGPG